MSRRIPWENGAIRTLIANQVVQIESSTRVTQFFPKTIRSRMAAAKGRTAVATRAYGLRSSNMPATGTIAVYRRWRFKGQVVQG